MTVTPCIVVHGGAGEVAPELHAAVVEGATAAAEAGRAVLLAGGSSEDAVVAAVRVLEDLEAFNAGRGACMTSAGTFEMDAALMRSRDLAIGGVMAVPDVRDTIEVARLVMNASPHALLAGTAAIDLARAHGVGHFGRDQVWTRKAQGRFDAVRSGQMSRDGRADTVGAVAIDVHGDLCAGGSTGGVLMKSPGRVGDTPLVGSGFYAHPELGAAVATGMGEAIMTHVASLRALQRMAAGEDPDGAAATVCEMVAAHGATCGIVAVLPDGRAAVAHRSPHMSWAIARGDAPTAAGLGR